MNEIIEKLGQKMFPIFRRHFRKTSPFNLRLLSTNFSLVAFSIKPAFLLDFNPFPQNLSEDQKLLKMEQLLEEIASSTSDNNFTVPRFMMLNGSDILIFNQNQVSENLSIKIDGCQIVNVSDSLRKPQFLIDESVIAEITEMIANVKSQISKHSIGKCLNLKTEDSWNISTLFGLLLNYPVVYYYSDLSSCQNCLAHINLLNIKLFLALVDDNDDGKDQILISSFTFPETLKTQCLENVDCWRKNLEEMWKSLHFKLKIDVVNLDVVLL